MQDRRKACLGLQTRQVAEVVYLVELLQEVVRHQSRQDRLHSLDLGRQLLRLSLEQVAVRVVSLHKLLQEQSQPGAFSELSLRLNKIKEVLPSKECLVNKPPILWMEQNQVQFLVSHQLHSQLPLALQLQLLLTNLSLDSQLSQLPQVSSVSRPLEPRPNPQPSKKSPSPRSVSILLVPLTKLQTTRQNKH